MKYEKYLKFHCCNCGAPVNPNSFKCSYCDTPVSFKTYNPNRQIRLFAKVKNGNKVFLHETKDIEVNQSPSFDVYRDSTGMLHRYMGYTTGDMKITSYLTENIVEKYKWMQDIGIQTISVEDSDNNRLFEIDCAYSQFEISDINFNSLAEIKMNIVIDDFRRTREKDNLYVPDGCNCPNCGSPLRQRFGLCDYCGGWSEYLDAIV